jgi:putative copper export protein
LAAERPSLLPLTVTDVRLFLHILAASVWVGGQITLAGLVPGLRTVSPDAPRLVARRFNRIAWTAFVVVVATGLWNLAEVDLTDRGTTYQVTLLVKLTMVALTGVAAAVHAGARSKAALAAWAAVGLVAGLAAMLLGVQLHG